MNIYHTLTLIVIILSSIQVPHTSSSEDLTFWTESTDFIEGFYEYSIAVGTSKPSEMVRVHIYPPINSILEFKLIQVDSTPIIISNETITITETMERGVWWMVELPDRAPATYRFGVIRVTPEGIRGCLISTIYVPAQILNASLELDKSEYLAGEKPVMTIANHGPTTLNFGMYYWYERLEEDRWSIVGWDDRVWVQPLLIVDPNMEFEEVLDVPFVDEGVYRVGKEIMAEGTNISRIFYANFAYEGSLLGVLRTRIGLYGVIGLLALLLLYFVVKRTRR